MSSKSQDLSLKLTVNKSPHEVFHAINDVAAWWIGDVQGKAEKVGDRFTYRYKDFHTSSQKVIQLVPNEKIVWGVEDANLKFVKNKNEWKGTEIIFEIKPLGDGTEIRFTHRGLAPEAECFEACSSGWEFYVKKSLKNLLMNGEGLKPGF